MDPVMLALMLASVGAQVAGSMMQKKPKAPKYQPFGYPGKYGGIENVSTPPDNRTADALQGAGKIFGSFSAMGGGNPMATVGSTNDLNSITASDTANGGTFGFNNHGGNQFLRFFGQNPGY